MAKKISIDLQKLERDFADLNNELDVFEKRIEKLVQHFTSTNEMSGKAASAATQNIFKLGLVSQDYIFMLTGIKEEMNNYVTEMVEINGVIGKYLDSIQ